MTDTKHDPSYENIWVALNLTHKIARLTKYGEDHSNDAASTMDGLIEEARKITGVEGPNKTTTYDVHLDCVVTMSVLDLKATSQVDAVMVAIESTENDIEDLLFPSGIPLSSNIACTTYADEIVSALVDEVGDEEERKFTTRYKPNKAGVWEVE
jgi:hypothetical protein